MFGLPSKEIYRGEEMKEVILGFAFNSVELRVAYRFAIKQGWIAKEERVKR